MSIPSKRATRHSDVAPSFSLYSLIERSSTSNIFSEYATLLARWSYNIENAVIDERLHTDVFVGFQQVSRLARIAKRYGKVSAAARKVWVFAEPDAPIPDPTLYQHVTLSPQHKLAQEWFVVVNHPAYARALVAREITPPGTPQAERTFTGVLTSDRDMILHLEQSLVSALNPQFEA